MDAPRVAMKWYRRPWLVCLATAAAVLLAVYAGMTVYNTPVKPTWTSVWGGSDTSGLSGLRDRFAFVSIILSSFHRS